MWGLKFRFLFLIHFLLADLAHSQAPPPPHVKYRPEAGVFSIVPSSSSPVPTGREILSRDEAFIRRLVSRLANSLRGDLVPLPGNLSCSEVADGPWKGAGFSQDLLSLAVVPFMVSVGCELEAEELVRNLITSLGQDDTQELLEDIVALMRRSLDRSTSLFVPPKLGARSERHLQAMMFNIQQLAEDSGEKFPGLEKRCKGWMRMKNMALLGQKFDHGNMSLSEAQRVCRNLGFVCAGVMRDDPTSPESYRAVLRPGSRLILSPPSNQSECWVQSCGAWPGRFRRHGALQPDCVNEKEERVYKVVEWIPTVSTLYNLGTAVYYASMSCSDTAKERALMSAVDLGTDTLMAATGGASGIAGYALGAGLKTGVKAGVKYLLNRMNQEEDLLMNQNSWEEETFSFH